MPNPPKVDPVRRNSRVGPTKLPSEGRQGPPPSWPLADQSEAEESAWADLWRTPQAVEWDRLGWVRTVGRYCRVMVASEEPGANAALLAQATSLEDRLGLTPKAMRLLLWEVQADEVAQARQASSGKSARSRIKAV